MEEKILATSRLDKKWKKFLYSTIFVLLGLAVVCVLIGVLDAYIAYNAELDYLKSEYYNSYSNQYEYTDHYSVFGEWFTKTYKYDTFDEFLVAYTTKFDHPSYENFGTFLADSFSYFSICIPIIINWVFLFFAGIVTIIYFILKNCKLTISEKNIKGKSLFGKQVVLPLYQVSAYSTRKFLSVVSIATASGFVKFALIENYNEIGEVLQSLINERQEKTKTPIIYETKQESGDKLDDLKKLKELLDGGVITKEEFDIKKKEILGF